MNANHATQTRTSLHWLSGFAGGRNRHSDPWRTTLAECPIPMVNLKTRQARPMKTALDSVPKYGNRLDPMLSNQEGNCT